MIDKETYIQQVEGQLATWQHDIYKFKIITEEIGEKEPDRQIDYYQIIERIVNMEKSVTDKLTALKEGNDSDWQQLKEEIDAARAKINEAITTARSTIN